MTEFFIEGLITTCVGPAEVVSTFFRLRFLVMRVEDFLITAFLTIFFLHIISVNFKGKVAMS